MQQFENIRVNDQTTQNREGANNFGPLELLKSFPTAQKHAHSNDRAASLPDLTIVDEKFASKKSHGDGDETTAVAKIAKDLKSWVTRPKDGHVISIKSPEVSGSSTVHPAKHG